MHRGPEKPTTWALASIQEKNTEDKKRRSLHLSPDSECFIETILEKKSTLSHSRADYSSYVFSMALGEPTFLRDVFCLFCFFVLFYFVFCQVIGQPN